MENINTNSISILNNKLKHVFLIAIVFLINYSLIFHFDDSFSYIGKDYDSNKLLKFSNNLRNLEYTRNDNLDLFYSNISENIFTGQWNSKDLPHDFEINKGMVRIHINKGFNTFTNNTYFIIVLKLYENEFIDKWFYIKGKKEYNETIINSLINFTDNKLTLNMSNAYIIEGNLFDRVSENYECETQFNISWSYSNNKIDKISGIIVNHECELPLNINFNELTIENTSYENLRHIYYSLMVSIMIIFQIYVTILLNHKIFDNFTNSNSLSLFTVGQNIIWNAYGCLCHFFLAVNNEQYVPHFGIPAFLFFTNFSVFELRLLYNLWRNQNYNDLNDINIIRKKLIKFYITFYIFLFLSLFFVTKFYFEKIYILMAISITWIPQIIHNVVYKNKLSMPMIYIILNTLNKIALPLYFRGFSDNIFYVKTDQTFVYICLVIILAQILFMYIQSLLGGRFFLPCLKISEHKYYYTLEELINLKKEFEFV